MAQRLTKDSDDITRRYAYGLLVKVISIGIFVSVGAHIFAGSIIFGFARW
jgi:hypothetical protein